MNRTPEEPEDAQPGPEEGGGGREDGDAPLRGWIDPDDRLWRHPSEVAGSSATPPLRLESPPRHSARTALMIAVGVGAVMAALAWVVVLLSPGSQRPFEQATHATEADAPLPTLAGTQNTVPEQAQAAGHAMVELRATTAHGEVTLIGVAVAEGGLVATSADALGGLQHIVVVDPAGATHAASLVATDRASDVALVEVPEDLPVAPFADDATLAQGAPDLTLSFVGAGGSSHVVHCTPGSVTGVGGALATGPAGGMPAITSSPAAPSVAAGEPLLNAQGAVVGLLYLPGTASTPTFLPSSLVVGVASDLRSSDKVAHGWLGISGADAGVGGGARIESVTTGGPAGGRLQSGQVIVAVNAKPVRTMAELRARLYVLSPGASVALSVADTGGPKVVDVKLGTSS